MAEIKRLSSGIKGLDEVLNGGFIPANAYLVRGSAGAGKTILGFHFLTSGINNGENVLFISLQETEQQLRERAMLLGMDISGVSILDLSPSPEFFSMSKRYDIFTPAEAERESLTHVLVQTVERIQPTRVFVDPITQFRYLAIDAFHFHRQILSLLKFLSLHKATVLLTSEPSPNSGDEDLQVMVDGIIRLEHAKEEVRTLSVQKFRGSGFREGDHSYRITDKGMAVFINFLPKIKYVHSNSIFSSGVQQIDELLSGGVERGTVTLITGTSGTGKTSLGMQFIKEAYSRGERSIVFTFEEESEILLKRCESIGIPARTMAEAGKLKIYNIPLFNFDFNELAMMIIDEIENKNTCLIMIDSITSYYQNVQNKNDVIKQIKVLGSFLKECGAALFIISTSSKIIENTVMSEFGVSALADNIIFLSYMEIRGEMRKTIGVLKKRLSDFENTLREFKITRNGIEVGQPLTNYRGILSGIPEEIK